MTTTKKPAAKKPTAAELARREAQSKKDTGAPQPVHVEVMGIALDINPEDLDDYDAMMALEQNNPRPMLELFFPDEDEREAALDSLRDESGKLRFSTTLEFVGAVFKAIGRGN